MGAVLCCCCFLHCLDSSVDVASGHTRCVLVQVLFLYILTNQLHRTKVLPQYQLLEVLWSDQGTLSRAIGQDVEA